MKTCRRCGVKKPPEEFYRENRNQDGRRSYCKACDRVVEQRRRRYAGSYVAGYRDKQCPICGEGYFVSASIHAGRKHGVHLKGMHPPFAYQDGEWALYESPTVKWRRWRRWAAAVREEEVVSGDYVKRLAVRWRITVGAAQSRIKRLVAVGLIAPRPRLPGAFCVRGHSWDDPANVYEYRGQRFCRTCNRQSGARQKRSRHTRSASSRHGA